MREGKKERKKKKPRTIRLRSLARIHVCAPYTHNPLVILEFTASEATTSLEYVILVCIIIILLPHKRARPSTARLYYKHINRTLYSNATNFVLFHILCVRVPKCVRVRPVEARGFYARCFRTYTNNRRIKKKKASEYRADAAGCIYEYKRQKKKKNVFHIYYYFKRESVTTTMCVVLGWHASPPTHDPVLVVSSSSRSR